MIVKNSDGSPGGFIHDFDYGSNWQTFLLAAAKSPANLATWTQYAAEEYLEVMRKKMQGEVQGEPETSGEGGVDASRNEPGPSRGGGSSRQAPPHGTPTRESKDERMERLKGEQKQRTVRASIDALNAQGLILSHRELCTSWQ